MAAHPCAALACGVYGRALVKMARSNLCTDGCSVPVGATSHHGWICPLRCLAWNVTDL